jgi:peptidoglycan/LPS O-acetylase OafA/YrhL
MTSPTEATRGPSGRKPAAGAAKAGSGLSYMPGVDGLRALAVTAVVVYHMGAGWLPGGFLGVDVFLVISGYLITSLLLAEFRKAERLDLKRFWMRRARRLLPALLVMIAVVLVAMLILHTGEVARLRGAVLASLGYVTNWYFVFVHQPYFAQFGRPSVFEHLWSLAVEEQFYLIWPPLLALGLLFWRRRGFVLALAAGIIGSTVLAWVLFTPDTDPSRIYYGTDTRAVGLLVGVLLAFLWPAGRLRPVKAVRAKVVLDVVGLAGLALLLVAMAKLGEVDRQLYQGGFLVVALATALVIAATAHPSSHLGKVFGLPLLVWIGLRSYGIYLWHWPILMLTRARTDIPLDGWRLNLLQIALTVGIAALSYKFIETPIRRRGFGAVRDWLPSRPARRVATLSGAAALTALVLAVALVPARTPVIPGLSDVASAATPPTPARIRAQARAADRAEARAAPHHPHKRAAAAAAAPTGPILAVGDSVMLGASSALRADLGPRVVIDAVVSRQFSQGSQEVLADERETHAKVVVIHLGTNGFAPFPDMKAMLDGLRGAKRVVLVTVRVPDKPWEKSVNDALRYAADHWRNVVLADWHTVADANAQLLVDGVHPNPQGARLYAQTIARAIRGGSS